MLKKKQPFPLATALRAGLKGYDVKTFRSDFTAGLVVSLVALPLAMALAIAVGLPPRHGLYTAIVAGIVCAVFGGSMVQVSGPTAAFVVIVAPIVRDFGLHGIIWCSIIAGFILILMGSFRLGRLIDYVPYPVVTGFTAGIAVTIGTLALNDFFGLGIAELKGSFIEKAVTIVENLPAAKAPDLIVGMATLLSIFFLPRLTARVPAPAAGIAIGALVSFVLSHYGADVDTLNTRFSYVTPEGLTMPGIQPYPPVLHLPGGGDPLLAWPDYTEFKVLFRSALVIAALAALESLLSATVADSMARTHHDPNAELNGIGIANIFSGLAGGIPATGAIARTSANIHSGAKTPVAAIIHALLILLYVMTLAEYISYIPMAALAALLISVAWRMSHAWQFVRIIRIAPRSDTVVLVTCFLLTVLIDMVAGVTVGMVMAALLFMKRIADFTNLHVSTHDTPDRAHGRLPKGVMVYRIEGPLFFGSINKTLEGADYIAPDVKKLILDLSQVPLIDVTGMMGIKTFLMSAAQDEREIFICGARAVTDRISQKIAGLPLARRVQILPTVQDALNA
jgi:sulfate permease, SulP family